MVTIRWVIVLLLVLPMVVLVVELGKLMCSAQFSLSEHIYSRTTMLKMMNKDKKKNEKDRGKNKQQKEQTIMFSLLTI